MPDFSSDEHLLHVQRLFIEHQPVVRACALAIVRDFALAEDVVQETFLAVTRKAGDFTPGSNFTAWAARIARFEALNALRRARKMALSEETLDVLMADEAAVMTDCRADWLERCVGRLTPNVQRMLHLCYSDGCKPAEVARVVGWTPNAVTVALSRARAALRECIEKLQQAEAAS